MEGWRGEERKGGPPFRAKISIQRRDGPIPIHAGHRRRTREEEGRLPEAVAASTRCRVAASPRCRVAALPVGVRRRASAVSQRRVANARHARAPALQRGVDRRRAGASAGATGRQGAAGAPGSGGCAASARLRAVLLLDGRSEGRHGKAGRLGSPALAVAKGRRAGARGEARGPEPTRPPGPPAPSGAGERRELFGRKDRGGGGRDGARARAKRVGRAVGNQRRSREDVRRPACIREPQRRRVPRAARSAGKRRSQVIAAPPRVYDASRRRGDERQREGGAGAPPAEWRRRPPRGPVSCNRRGRGARRETCCRRAVPRRGPRHECSGALAIPKDRRRAPKQLRAGISDRA